MRAMFRNETKKLFSKKKTYITMVLFILLCSFQVFVSFEMARHGAYDRDSWIRDTETYMAQIEQNLKELKQDPNIFGDYKIEDALKEYNEILRQLAEAKQQTPQEFRNNAIQKEYEQMQGAEPGQGPATELEKKVAAIHEKNARLNIPPGSSEINGLNYLIQIQQMLMIFLMFGLAIFGGDLMNSEMNPPTFKHLLTQPVTRRNVWLSKYLTYAFWAIILIMGIQLIFFAGVSAVWGIGDAQKTLWVDAQVQADPVHEWNFTTIAQSGREISLLQFTLESFLLEALAIAAILAFMALLSTLIKTPMVSTALSVAIGIFYFIMLAGFALFAMKLLPFIFLTYQGAAPLYPRFPGQSILGSLGVNTSMGLGFTVLTGTTFVCLVLGLLAFRKKDILA